MRSGQTSMLGVALIAAAALTGLGAWWTWAANQRDRGVIPSRDAWVAVVGRTNYILANYQGASVIRQTLELQLQAYEKLEMDELARDTQRILELNYADRS